MALSTDAVVGIALQVVDEQGPAALTLAAVAGRAGVATPSLYKHVRNLAELRSLVSAKVLAELADRCGEAVLGRSADEAIRAFMLAWRAYAREHPHRYSAVIQPPNPALAAAGDRLVGVALATMRGYGLEGADAIHATRCLRSAIHGFAVLETEGGFGLPEKLDDSYDLLIRMMTGGLSGLS